MTAADHSDTPPSISLHTAAILTGRSLRTWQRRIEDGLVPRLGDGTRAQVPFAVVQQAMEEPPSWGAEDVQTLVDADQGDALAQAEMGAQFALLALRGAAAPTSASGGGGGGQHHTRIARYFLERAAEQGEADAMHWLGLLYAARLGEPGEDNPALALMWIAKAAAHGHVIAREQLAALLPHSPNPPNSDQR